MTCIVGIKKDSGEVIIGADSAGVGGLDLRVRAPHSKLIRNGGLLMGCTTSFRMIDLLRHHFTAPGVYEDQKPIDYIVKSVIPAIRTCFKDGGFASKESERERGGTFLIGFRGELFTIYDDYQVAQSADNFAACGCGEAYAIGSLYSTHGLDNQQPIDRLSLALQAAETYSAGVRGPFDFLTLEAHKPAEVAAPASTPRSRPRQPGRLPKRV